MDAKYEKAISFLKCPKCGGDFNCGKEKIACNKCGFSAKIKQEIIFCFEESELSKNVMEKTMYGPEQQELESDLSDKKAARISFLEYFPGESSSLIGLDFGCGSSRQIFDLADQFGNGTVFGVDCDSEPLGIIAQTAHKLKYKNIFLVQNRSAGMPFKENIFDVVTSHQVLEHLAQPEKSVSEICRTMKKNGIFEVDFPNGNSASEILRNIFHNLTGTKNPHISRIGLKKARKMFEKNGFKIRKIRSVQILTGPLSYFIEGLFLRYIMERNKIWESRKKYQNNIVFRALCRTERKISKYFPRMGHAFEFILTKI